MSERFTERARQVVVLAQVEARVPEHNYIGLGDAEPATDLVQRLVLGTRQRMTRARVRCCSKEYRAEQPRTS